MDSQGPEVKIRGTAAQIHDKYQALARDAFSSGDRIRGESLMQHAEHYYRLMKSMQPEKKDEPKRDDQTDQPQVEAQDETAPQDEATAEAAAEPAEAKSDETDASSGEEEVPEVKPRRRRRRRKADETEAGTDEKPQDAAPDTPALEEAAAE